MSYATRQRAASATPTDDSAGCLRLLSCNILAGGSVSSYRDYVMQSWKQVLPMRGKRGNLDRFAKLLSEFDLVGLQEAEHGESCVSGFLNQTQYLAEAAGFPYWSHQPNRKIAQFAASSNGLLERDWNLPKCSTTRCPAASRAAARWTAFRRRQQRAGGGDRASVSSAPRRANGRSNSWANSSATRRTWC